MKILIVLLLLSILLISCNSRNNTNPLSKKKGHVIAPKAITSILYTKDNGTVAPASYRKKQYNVTPDQIVLTERNDSGDLVNTTTTALTPDQFTAICTELANHKINEPCNQSRVGAPIPPGGYSSSIVINSKDKQTKQKYYVAAGNTFGCGNIIAFDIYLKSVMQ